MQTVSPLPISILILSGGRGSRMGGEDKGLVELNQQAFIEHALKIARPYSNDLIISCNRNQERYRAYGDTLVTDHQENFPGPLAGIQAGMHRARYPALVVLPCDTPMIPEDLPLRLYQAYQQRPDAITVVNDGERLQPLHAIIPTRYRESLDRFLQGGERGVIHWYRKQPLEELHLLGQARAFTNINSPEELRAIEDAKP